jgi:hypothetical protein
MDQPLWKESRERKAEPMTSIVPHNFDVYPRNVDLPFGEIRLISPTESLQRPTALRRVSDIPKYLIRRRGTWTDPNGDYWGSGFEPRCAPGTIAI